MSLYQALKQASLRTPKETAIYYFGNKISYEELLEEIDEKASVLQNMYRIEKGDVVIISLPNVPETLVLFYAVNKIGGISNMVHPNTPFETMQQYYDEANTKLAFLYNAKVYKELKAYKNFNGNIVLSGGGNFLPLRKKEAFFLKNRRLYKDLYATQKFNFYHKLKSNNMASREVLLDSNETAVLLHSASTTGISKTICLGSRSFNFTAEKIPEIMCMSQEELVGKSLISVLPSFHGFGLCMCMHAPLVNSFGIVLIPKFHSKFIVKSMEKYKNVICINGVPSIFEVLVRDYNFVNSKYLKTLQNCFCGGDSLSHSLKERFDTVLIRKGSKCRLYEGYGLTEALSVCAVNTHRHHKNGSVGYPLSGVRFMILDEGNNELPPNEVGEIAVKCENSMIGYFNDKEATEATYYNDYLKTGDLGYIDEDGFIFYNSRKKRVIKVNGVAVFPHEIELVISKLSGVKEVCVIQIPDEKTVNATKAYVVSTNKDVDRIITECKKRLITWSIPREVEFVNSLPKTKYNKIDYKKVQEMENAKRKI